ncbi:polysaccharide deacetylase family protein [Thalassobacillus devorans]|uniref:polysaccharide deacetylase family protein n=1 Tax=Thalassobacillus devorans TaxID=279813 RepID=UPI00048CD84D|nr:polysaccharide deacetylase family protein [Thalassobacillus devorans]
MKQMIISVTILLLLLLTACSLTSATTDEKASEQSGSNNNAQLNVEIESIIEEYEDYRLAVHFPQTSNAQLNQIILDYVKKEIAKFKQESYQLKQEEGSEKPHEFNIDFELLHTSGGVVSIEFKEFVDYGKKQPVIGTNVLNFDVAKGKRLQLVHLFKKDSDYLSKLSQYVINQLRTHERLGSGFDEEWMEQAILPQEKSFRMFTLHEDGMTFYYQPSNNKKTAPVLKVTVPEYQLTDMMKERYIEVMKHDSSEPLSENLSSSSEETQRSTKQLMDKQQGKQIALTFDDGPHPTVTKQVLEELEAYGGKATFFVLGNRLAYYPELVKKIAANGHEIGNHSWNHRELTRLEPSAIEEQLQRTSAKLQELTGKKPGVVKAPYGHVDKKVQQAAGVPIIHNTHDIEIWRLTDPQAIINEVMAHAEDGAIISLQEASPYVSNVIDPLLRRLHEEGYQFVTVSQLRSDGQADMAGNPPVLSSLP